MTNSSQSDLVWMIRHDENPYNAVRGYGGYLPSSMTAIRSLLALNHHQYHDGPDDGDESHHNDDYYTNAPSSSSPHISESETASQLAEGTVRAWRDLALDEAVELQMALRYWTSRWERPFLSWLEALPFQIIGQYPYNHQEIGSKVGRLQAVLARRCAAIGELQQRLLEAGWREGVAQWGVLGGGHSWAAVAGFDPTPRMAGGGGRGGGAVGRRTQFSNGPEAATTGGGAINDEDDDEEGEEEDARLFTETGGIAAVDVDDEGPLHMDESRREERRGGGVFRRSSQAQIFVGRQDGDGVYVDDPSFLAEWSVESIRLIRRQLLRAGNNQVELPCGSHWTDVNGMEQRIPSWATTPSSDLQNTIREYAPSLIVTSRTSHAVTISNLPAMVKEIGELLDVMQRLIVLQRSRRLDQMRPPTWIRRNWYIIAAVVPPSMWLGIRLLRGGSLRSAISHVCGRIGIFFTERVWTPLNAM
jgi:hypothetical protein